MPVRFAINGVGRIGRALVRIAAERSDLELVAVNDLADAEQLARLLARDTLHGPFAGEVRAEADELLLNGRRVRVFREERLKRIPWRDTPAEIVVDATGLCVSRELAEAHLGGGVVRVVVSANAEGMDLTVCVGVNDGDFDPASHRLLSAASCTTNCLVPVAALLHRSWGLERGLLNTVHSYNNDQRLLEYPHRDPRRARAAALNMIPTTTSAVEAMGRVLPELRGRIAGYAVRVPTPNVSLIDLAVELSQRPSLEEVREGFRRAAQGELEGILAVTEEPLVSSDYLGDPHSAVVDLPLMQSIDDRLFRVVAWYDNEWGHAARLADLLELAGSAG